MTILTSVKIGVKSFYSCVLSLLRTLVLLWLSSYQKPTFASPAYLLFEFHREFLVSPDQVALPR